MSNNTPEATLADALARETAWENPQTQIWKSALTASSPRPRVQGFKGKRFGHPLLLLLLLLPVCGLLVLVTPFFQTARSAARRVVPPAEAMVSAPVSTFSGAVPAPSGLASLDAAAADRRGTPVTEPPAPGHSRHVIRKATIELQSSDVRGVFARIGLIVNIGAGEYVESSSIRGEETPSAEVTLRVDAARLHEVLNQLRKLGVVVQETSSGEDVTERVVDLEARLKNEQQIEQELLELLAKRENAQLSEILELRAQIGRVREGIERLVAQREGLRRLTSLATILVILRHDAAPTKPEGWWQTFRENISSAGRDGLDALSDAVAFLVWLAVGGLLWWVLIAVCIMVGLRMRRLRHRRLANEPAPRLDD